MQPFQIARQVLMSIPLGFAWVLMLLFVFLGWGIDAVDVFVKKWEEFVHEADFSIRGGEQNE